MSTEEQARWVVTRYRLEADSIYACRTEEQARELLVRQLSELEAGESVLVERTVYASNLPYEQHV